MAKNSQVAAFKVWSNVFYLVPLLLALYLHLWPTAVLVLAVISFGALYHFSNEKRFLWPDRASAWLLISSNLVLCYLGGFRVPYFPIAVLFLLLSLFYHFYLERNGEYELNHGMWHLYGSLITLFCIFAFAA